MLLTEYDEKKHMRDTYREGFDDGEKSGYDKGEDSMARLVEILTREKRYEDLARVSVDKEYREKLMKEYKI